MNAVPLVALALVLSAPAVKKAWPPPKGKDAASVRRTLRLQDEDVRRLLHDWIAFDAAMSSLQEAVPALPGGGAAEEDLARAEAAWAADARIRHTLETVGTTPEDFLALYRRVAEAWWALAEAETRKRTAEGLRRELDALAKVDAPETRDVAAELQRGLDALEPRDAPAESPDLDVVRRHRADLTRIFSPEAPGP